MVRSKIITRRTYNRPLNDEGTRFETWEQTIDRVIGHQKWLWERAKGGKSLTPLESDELEELRQLMLDKKASVSGRTLWLGGTDVAKRREASQFNCAYTEVKTIHDVVDMMWLLLQGCGVGFRMKPGILNGFTKPIEKIVVRRSQRTSKGGKSDNVETLETVNDKVVWKISVGDSAEAWAKAIGKLVAGKAHVDVLVLDFSEIRPAGSRLSGYGWISSGDAQLANAMEKIAEILNKRAGQLLTGIDILDIGNWLGTTLSSRRSAEIALMDYDSPEWEDFAVAKHNHFENNSQRAQSNNSIVFNHKPKKSELKYIFKLIQEGGGSEPGFINATAALARAPWFSGVNPCAEILLGDKSFCNLVELNVAAFKQSDPESMLDAAILVARANYRQTCVNLDDGILQRTWHELNEFLRLTGVGLTGLMQRLDLFKYPTSLHEIAQQAQWAIDLMADELGLPRSKLCLTIKPSGTLSKVMMCTEGAHKPLGKFIFNNINFSVNDPILAKLEKAGYRIFANPYDEHNMLVTLPVKYDNVEFTEVNGKFVNTDTAIEQLERYKYLMTHYVTHNCSITISYGDDEIKDIVDWIHTNWDDYVGVSFLPRMDASKSAADLGFPYLPQEVVTEEEYDAYVATLGPVDLDDDTGAYELDVEDCVGGVCPVR